jgi:hypothetical protein
MITSKQIFNELIQSLCAVQVNGYDKPRPMNWSGKKIKFQKILNRFSLITELFAVCCKAMKLDFQVGDCKGYCLLHVMPRSLVDKY